MTINVWRPFSDMLSLREAMDRLLESSFVRPGSYEEQPEATLPVDMYETEDNLVIITRVPGVNPDDLEITATEEALTIKGHLGSEAETEEAQSWRWLRRELWTGDFQRVIPLGTRVQLDKIDAHFERGLLTLTLPKAKEVKPKNIKVKIS